MRAKEFLSTIRFNIEPYEAWSGWGVIVQAFDGDEEVGHVIFEPTDDDETQWYAADVEVEAPYQRKGIATKMYNMAKKAAKKQGAIIVRSHTQTDDGRNLWRDKKVWEQVNEQMVTELFNARKGHFGPDKLIMKISEILTESKVITFRGEQFKVSREYDADTGADLTVWALDAWGNSIGYAKFATDDKELDPRWIEVKERNRGQGVMEMIYDFVKFNGYTINRSTDQTPDGRKFWDKHRGPSGEVWESE